MPFTSAEIAAIVHSLDAICTLTRDRLARQTAPTPALQALDDAAFQTTLARNAFLSVADPEPPLALQEAH